MKPDELNEPVNRLLRLGQRSLTDNENLSLILAGEKSIERAEKVLQASNFNYDSISRMTYSSLKKLGLSHLQAVRLIATLEFTNRKALQISEERVQIKQSKDVFDILSPYLSDLPHEEFWVLYLNRNNKILCKEKISQGGISGTVTDVRLVLKKAIEVLASGIIVSHNHPSGNLNPSESDTKITKKIKDAGDIIDVQLLDHIVISGKDYYSFADNGIL